jgi:Fe-S cluster biogenesis protein NfuA
MRHTASYEKINEVLEQIRPLVVGHGGNIEFVKYEEQVVFVRLFGACTNCPLSLYTVKYGIEEKLREILPELQRVEVV